MSACNFEYLLRFVNNELDLDKQLDIYDHLDRCDICRDAVFQISRDLDKLLFFYCAQRTKHTAMQHQTRMPGTGRAQLSAKALSRPAMARSFNRFQ